MGTSSSTLRKDDYYNHPPEGFGYGGQYSNHGQGYPRSYASGPFVNGAGGVRVGGPVIPQFHPQTTQAFGYQAGQPVLYGYPNQNVQMSEPETELTRPPLSVMPEPQTANMMATEEQSVNQPVIPNLQTMEDNIGTNLPVPEVAPAGQSAPISMPLPTDKALPEPPRPVEIPAHLLSGTAVTQQNVHQHHVPTHHERPLSNPLPEPPVDVYDTPRYRELTRGLGAIVKLPVQVYPDGWFDKEDHHHHRHHSEQSHGKSWLSRLKLGGSLLRPYHGSTDKSRKRGSIPLFSSQNSFSKDSGSYGNPNGYPIARSISTHRPPPPFYSAPVVMPNTGIPYGPQLHIRSQSVPGFPIQPYQSVPGPPIRFNSHTHDAGFCHFSPHTILYKKKLYPSALHLLEAFKFLGKKNDLAERVRTTEGVEDVLALTRGLRGHVRKDWEQIVREKMDEVLYLKFRQHGELRSLLMSTGFAELIYSEENDPFWGDGSLSRGANELGRSLVRVREQLRREGAR